MSQAQPFQPNLHPDQEQGIPAADPGPGAPPTAPGFGEAYEPAQYGDDEDAQGEDGAADGEPSDPDDRADSGHDGTGESRAAERGADENVFQTPDPDRVERDHDE